VRCRIGGLAVLGPGLPGWAASEAVLAGREPWVPGEVALPPPALLPPTERRRTSPAVRLALAAVAEAATGEDAAALDTIFASSNGDGTVVGAILEALTDPAGAISPTQFHNSVHNAAAGYWGIGVGSLRPSVSVGGHDDTLAAGLLQAVAAVATGGEGGGRGGLLFCAYDAPLPQPLAGVRHTTVPFAAAMVLRPVEAGGGSPARAVLELRYVAEPAPAAPPPVDALDALAAENPVARALPLLRALAARRPARLRLPLLGDAHLDLVLEPC
jgi:Beta-ketoacyl synthase, N-terminal domain